MRAGDGIKQAVITGAAGGIGTAIVETFIADDYRVYGIDLIDQQLSYSGTQYKHTCIDITQFERLSGLFSTEISFEDNPVENVLINCARIREILSIEELTLSIWDEVFKTNVTAPFVASKAFCSALINHGLSGSIINIASTSGVLGEPHRTAYVASKHAVIGLTKQLAIEYGEFDIRVNAIAPGIIRTPMTEHYFNTEKQRQAVEQGQFIKHTGLPMDVAGAAMYLASNKARFLTGTTIVMDGGWTAGKRL